MATISRKEADQFIKNLRTKTGGITQDDRDFLKKHDRLDLLEVILTLRRRLGASTRTLATNLYAKDTRFVFELIQNAEDNKYSIAESALEDPFLSFTLERGQIIIDSNEDGFTEQNIQAICSVGESTKANSQGYIGEKGIGFKSVFKVARKVHVQSGPFSFSFEYNHDDDEAGLGMVTPILEEHPKLPESVRTRMILSLSEDCDWQALRGEFLGLPDTLLLFLKKLKKLKIAVPGRGFGGYTESIEYELTSSRHRASITKRMLNPDSIQKQDYWITKREVNDMPRDNARRNITRSEVLLAFPLDDQDIPIIEVQHAFAFLPLRKAGFKAIEMHSKLQAVMALRIVPLSTGNWASPQNASIYFPFSEGVEIPDDLPLSLVDTLSLSNESRKVLFTRLGITECKPELVFPLINQQYQRAGTTRSQALSHIKFVFWHNRYLQPNQLGSIRIPPQFGNHWLDINSSSVGRWAYCPRSEHAYSMYKVLESTMPAELEQKTFFPTISCYKMLEQLERRHNLTGIEWFRGFIEAKETPQFSKRNKTKVLSAEIKYVVDHSSHFLLGALEACQSQYPPQSSTEAYSYFKQALVPILRSEQRRPLKDTRLPLPKLRSIVARLGLEEGFGFCAELEGITDDEITKWKFLSTFGVIVDEDVSFWIALLDQARIQSTEPRVIFEIYSNLQRYFEDGDWGKIANAFGGGDKVFIPSGMPDGRPCWTTLETCVWDAPDWFSFKNRLEAIDGYQTLHILFGLTLGVESASVDDFLANLGHIKEATGNMPEEESKIPLLYQELSKESKEADTAKDAIRSQFESDQLVYHPQTRSWHAPSACIWAEERIHLPGKVSIATAYKGHTSFFCSLLKVPKPDLDMHIAALQQKTLHNPDRQSILEEVINICALGPTPHALESLSATKCFPVRRSLGAVEWVNREHQFVVVDRNELAELFAGKADMLDYSLEESHSIKPFLLGMGLQNRSISRMVKEKTTVQGGSPAPELTRNLRKIAYAIFRYAAHFGGRSTQQEPAAAYERLQTMEILTSDGISQSVSLPPHGPSSTVQTDHAYFHLDHQENVLKLYVPKDKEDREICLSTELPIALLKHLGVEDHEQGRALGTVITASSLSVVEKILEHQGIISVEGITRPQEELSPEPEARETVSTPISRLLSRSETPSTLASGIQSPSETLWRRGAGLHSTPDPVPSDWDDDVFSTPGTSVYGVPPGRPERLTLYRDLLDGVIRQAANLSDLPVAGQILQSPSVPHMVATWDAIASSYFMETDFKIGVAGELFVFELLQSLGLPDFGRHNWQSTIRGRAKVHKRYSDIQNWAGSETADIVYQDRDCTLTKLLVEKGYLRADVWADHSPEYYIEVKTTVSTLKTPFYCSQLQYDRMETMRLVGNIASDKIYLVARVFALGDSGMGLKLYLDPATLRSERQLDFRAEKYSVTPLA
ncbi:hypothetical protein P152DRAFT_428616 [Eremomyces bilateralis CBS 781.70]|uniref:Sacsin/Nov domain-containing protein n=1 Tax=Eremomyces bilateralis CBS 781.70 TaxID=1392243 RepID=A0A6G1GF02_9PEZI|nr:uncharacterized protein P152DRAFT_428616 [Eremomyces bilateralis CBS 781.70]KAF1816496.1 hypothetical protein P152DRAFT_428616 [Eremomyces bilateralis CBS 781.70]